jgi:hypothetical protein
MNRTCTWLAAALLIGYGSGCSYSDERRGENERPDKVVASQPNAPIVLEQPSIPITTRPTADKAIDAGLPKGYPRPTSAWLSNEKAFYERLLSGGRFDLLVVPFQVQDYALDQATRSFMTAQLALSLTTSNELRAPDPYLVARALGEGQRRINREDVLRLAHRLGVKRIVWGYVGHDRKNRMTLTIQSQELPSLGQLGLSSEIATHNFENIPFTDENPPIEVYQSLLPDVIKALGLKASALNATKPESQFSPDQLPTSPLEIASEKPEPAHDAYYLQLLASLTPEYAATARRRFAEKSLLAIHTMSSSSPDYRVLKARAFMQLGLRPAALQVLGKPETVEEKALFAALNGNLPDVKMFASQLKPGIRLLLASLDANVIASHYGVIKQKQAIKDAQSLKLPGKIWPFITARAFVDWDSWFQQQNIPLKGMLDTEFPIQGFSLEDIVGGAASLADMSKMQTMADLSVFNHVRRWMETEPERWRSQMVVARPTILDYLDLIDAIGTDNLMRQAKFLTSTQGSPERALEFLRSIENVYNDHPQFALAKANAKFSLARNVEGTEETGLRKSAHSELMQAMYWEQGQTPTAAEASSWLQQINRRSGDGYIDNLYSTDYPYRPFYPTWQNTFTAQILIDKAETALRNSMWDFLPVMALVQHYEKDYPEKIDPLFRSIENRFIGNPSRAIQVAQRHWNKGDIQKAELHYRESIKTQPSYWPPYEQLGLILFEDGQTENAAKLFMSYPGFKKDSDENRVGISNNAYRVGSLFYWSGNFSQAVPLYQIAAAQQTGADSDMSSQIRLKILNSDYLGAMMGSLERGKRYNSSYAYRDYLGLLHAMGYSKEAWDAFNVLKDRSHPPHIWETVLVGHRMIGASQSEIVAWTKRATGGDSRKAPAFAATYVLRAGVTDRMPNENFAQIVSEFAPPISKFLDSEGRETMPINRAFEPGKPFPKPPVPTEVKSDLAQFADAYRAMRSGDFERARSELQQASMHYDMSQERFGYILPYLAYAAAKSGNVSAVEKELDRLRFEDRRFDYYLSKAVIAGIGGKIDESAKMLKAALHRRPYTEYRPLYTEYQYAEICEWLYESTNHPTYRDLALEWVKKSQTFQPWFAWAYAMEAKLARNPKERDRAIAMAYYLDRNSERLAKIPKQEIDAAVKKFSRNNPFLKKPKSTKRDSV